MRGKETISLRTLLLLRITPAHAGKSRTYQPCCRRTPDHPRACGEKPKTDKHALVIKGSPPRMRGKVNPDRGVVLDHGITPAHAGKRSSRTPWWAVARDHPRACGEKKPKKRRKQKSRGSPPRMRGKVVGRPGHVVGVGITPAHAGKR